jgi:ABC-2 type transport system permease protein
MAVPLSVTMTSVFDLGMNLVALFIFMLVTGVSPRISWLELPLLMLPMTMLIAGLSMVMSVLYVRYRDVDQIWLVVRQALFYATPTLYVAAALPFVLRRALSFNPLAAIFTQARQALIDPSAPSAATSAGGPLLLLIPAAIVIAAFVAGLVVFHRHSERVAESL